MISSTLLVIALAATAAADCQRSGSKSAELAWPTCDLHVFKPGSDWRGPESCLGEYCIYWNPKFNQGAGIAVVMTADHAQKTARFAERIGQHRDAPPYTIAPVPGKGNGVIANRDIGLGEVIMVQAPVILVNSVAYQGLTNEESNEMYTKALAKVSDGAREAFMRQYGEDVVVKVDKNGFTVFVDQTPNSQHIAVFTNASIINHDCRPNINYRVNNLTHTTTAVRHILPGEELSVSYVDLMLPREQRRQRLRDWGFDCTCRQCTLDAAASARSDANLAEIQRLERELDSPESTAVSADTGERLVALYSEERLDIYLGPAYTRAALNYGLFGERAKAVEYAGMAVAALERQYGPDALDIPSMTALMEEPETHWSWGLRRGRPPVINIPIPEDIPVPPPREV